MNLTSTLFRELLFLAVGNTFFIFNGKFYKQIEGLGMGLPLGPTFANIFMSYYEKIWLSNCPQQFKPVFYRRYIDDTFLLFKDSSHVNLFLDYLNSMHRNIRFTFEIENNRVLNFLDITVTRGIDGFSTSVYRKNTFTGLGSSFFSFCPFRFKTTAIQTLIVRAYRICSNFHSLHLEFQFLRNFFQSNGFPVSLVDKYIKKFLNSLYIKKTQSDSNSNVFYFSFPYFGHQSEKLKSQLTSCLSKFYPSVVFKLVFVNDFKIGSFFRFKDRIPKSMSSSLVYEFSCVRGRTPVSYIGSTKRHLYERVDEHANRSSRTGISFSTPSNSSIKAHCDSCVCNISLDSFRVIDSCKNELDLRILESLYIHKNRPNLNDHQSAFPLNITF